MTESGSNANFREQAVNTAMAYSLALSKRGNSRDRNKDEQETMMRLRDGLVYRAEAIDWHSMLVTHLVNGALKRLEASFSDPNASHDMLSVSAREQQFAFDDVVFNIIALFDYVGDTIGFAFHGDHRRKARWDRIVRYARDGESECRDNNRPRVATSGIAELVLKVDELFVHRLSEYRAELIHYETDPAKGTVQTFLSRNDQGSFDVGFDISTRVPRRFSKHICVPGYEAEPTKAPLTVASKWMASESQWHAAAILLELERELKKEAGEDPDSSKRTVVVF